MLRALSQSMIAGVPKVAGPSSSPVISSEQVPADWSTSRRRRRRRRSRLHVVGAAAGQPSAGDRGRKDAAPAFARRDDVEVAGKAEVRRSRPADRDQILDRPVRRLADDKPVHFEPQGLERGSEHVEYLAPGGRDAGAVDQRAGEVDRVD